MATKAHCAFCFESLSASFEQRQPLSLREVEDLWEQYHAPSKSNDGKSAVAADPNNDDDNDEEDGEDDDEMTDVEPETPSSASPPTSSSSARPAAISRLLNHDKSSAASSSSSLRSSGSGSASSSSKEAVEGRSGSGSSTPASSNTSLRSRLSAATKRRKTPAGGGDEEQYPLFVTWNTVSRSGGEHGKSLRGCIGTFEAQGLESGLRSYALTSAFEDVRFQPIPSSLLPRLSAHVTLLTNFTAPSPDPYAWTLGKHGIRIAFTHRGRRLGATYLPDVAREQGWTEDETLASLMRKAGWSGSGDWKKVWREGRGELVTYEGAQCGLGFEEWRAWREWVAQLGVERKRLN